MEEKEVLIREVLFRAAFRCCICKSKADDVFLIDPDKYFESENLISLCDDCKGSFVGDPGKRKKMKMMRDHWMGLVSKVGEGSDKDKDKRGYVFVNKEVRDYIIDYPYRIIINLNRVDHYEAITFGLVDAILTAQKTFPGADRIIEIDIEDHLDEKGNFDTEIQKVLMEFILEKLMGYIKEIHTPLYSAINSNEQINEIPKLSRWGFR